MLGCVWRLWPLLHSQAQVSSTCRDAFTDPPSARTGSAQRRQGGGMTPPPARGNTPASAHRLPPAAREAAPRCGGHGPGRGNPPEKVLVLLNAPSSTGHPAETHCACAQLGAWPGDVSTGPNQWAQRESGQGFFSFSFLRSTIIN